MKVRTCSHVYHVPTYCKKVSKFWSTMFELTAPPLGGWPIGPAGAAAAAPPSIHLGLNSATFALKVKSFAVALSLLAGLTGAASLSSAGFAVVSLESPAGVGAAAVSAFAVLSATVAS